MQEWQERIEETQRETDKRLTEMERKQQTEQIKVIVERQVEESPLLQTIYNQVGQLNTKVGTLEHEMQGARTDILAIRESQADFKDTLTNHGNMLNVLKDTQDEHSELLKEQSEMLKQILAKLQ